MIDYIYCEGLQHINIFYDDNGANSCGQTELSLQTLLLHIIQVTRVSAKNKLDVVEKYGYRVPQGFVLHASQGYYIWVY